MFFKEPNKTEILYWIFYWNKRHHPIDQIYVKDVESRDFEEVKQLEYNNREQMERANQVQKDCVLVMAKLEQVSEAKNDTDFEQVDWDTLCRKIRYLSAAFDYANSNYKTCKREKAEREAGGSKHLRQATMTKTPLMVHIEAERSTMKGRVSTKMATVGSSVSTSTSIMAPTDMSTVIPTSMPNIIPTGMLMLKGARSEEEKEAKLNQAYMEGMRIASEVKKF